MKTPTAPLAIPVLELTRTPIPRTTVLPRQEPTPAVAYCRTIGCGAHVDRQGRRCDPCQAAARKQGML